MMNLVHLTFASDSHSWLIGFIQVVEPFVSKAKFIHLSLMTRYVIQNEKYIVAFMFLLQSVLSPNESLGKIN